MLMFEKFSLANINPALSGSFSRHSLADGSEIISEAEEINEVKLLQRKGDECMKAENYESATRFYTEALEIDEVNVDIIRSRAAAYLGIKSYQLAFKDTETLISFNAAQPQAHYLHGVALDYLGKSQQAILAFLNALDLDLDNAELLCNHLLVLTASLCKIPEDKLDRLKGMDPYRKLTEVGSFLFHADKYELCIKVLNCAQKLQTNQRGITMKLLLTLANAHAAVQHTDIAISLYQDCLKIAVTAHDHQYQCKSLVSIASLFLEVNNSTDQAVFYYEKLIDLETEIISDEGKLPAFWTIQLQCALRLNLSIGYKKIGNMKKALANAQAYLKLLEESELKELLKCDSHHNVGMLCEILGDYDGAIDEYIKYEKTCKKTNNQKGRAMSYGCLGGVYAWLKNWTLAKTYLEQQIEITKRLNDQKLLNQALEQLADMYRMKGDDLEDALDIYGNIVKNCSRGDWRTKCNALFKIGVLYKQQSRYQYSLYYFEEALYIARDEKYSDIETLCEYQMATVYQHSTQMFDLDQSRKLFEKLIPMFERKIALIKEEGTFCSGELMGQLSDCYKGMQLVLSKIGNAEDNLRYAEASRQQVVIGDVGQIISLTSSLINLSGIQAHGYTYLDTWPLSRILRAVNQQSATVIYYSITGPQLLIWVLQPGFGLVRFYATKTHTSETMESMINKMLLELCPPPDFDSYMTEGRAVPLRDANVSMRQKQFTQLQNQSDKITQTQNGSEKAICKTSKKPIERRLFDLLLSPVGDILAKLTPESHLVFIPDGILNYCPFHALTDWANKTLSEKYYISYCPSICLLERASVNEIDQLKNIDDLEFERSCVKHGGLSRTAARFEGATVARAGNFCDAPCPRTLSNPLLLRNRTDVSSSGKSALTIKEKSTISVARQPISPSKGFGRVPPIKTLSGSDNSYLTPRIPKNVTRLLGDHTLSTVTTKTATNTDILSSTTIVPTFKQLSEKDYAVVIGNPVLPESIMLHGKPCRSLCPLNSGHKELLKVASYMSVEPIAGREASKARFLQEFNIASLIHITTYGCLKEGILVMAPNPDLQGSDPPAESTYIVTIDDLIQTKTLAKLVVLSSAWSVQKREFCDTDRLLPSAFIAAGAMCVVYFLWPMSNDVLDKFYFHFYQALEHGCLITTAVNSACKQLKADNRYSNIQHWAPVIVIGKDTVVDISIIRHSMLDQTLDKCEDQVAQTLGSNPLNPPDLLKVPDPETKMTNLQRHLGNLLRCRKDEPDVIAELINLLDCSLKRLFKDDLNKEVVHLPSLVERSLCAVDFLHFLGFNFQARNTSLNEPFIIFPHWDYDEVLVPAYDALRALVDLTGLPPMIQALVDFLPNSQENISYLIDMLSITKHATDIQLKISDLSVKSLWHDAKAKALLVAMGYQSIGQLLMFNSTPSNRLLLNCILQMMLSTSCYKSPVLLHKLDVNLLGTHRSKSISTMEEVPRLPTLMPLLLPRHQLCMATPWLSAIEIQGEMDEKMRLAQGKTQLSREFSKHMDRAKSWHEDSLKGQAAEIISELGKPKISPKHGKVKVMSGMSPSQARIAVNQEPTLTLEQTNQRRNYSHFILQKRLNQIKARQDDNVKKLYLPYIRNTEC